MARNLKPRQPPPEGDDDFAPTSGAETKRSKEVDYFADDLPPSKKTSPNGPKGDSKKKKKKHQQGTELPRAERPREIVTLDRDRKLSKKAQADLSEWRGKNHGRALDKLVAHLVTDSRKKFGHRAIFVGDEARNLLIGIPCPALAFEFLIGLDAFPLGLIIHLVGKAGTFKSALLAEFGRWFDMAGGLLRLKENETKFNFDWYESIMGPVASGRMTLDRCTSVEDWQRRLTHSLRQMRNFMKGTKEKPGPGRTFPVLEGIDSIMGKTSEETQEKILGKKNKAGEHGEGGAGAAGRGFPLEALSITTYLKTMPHLLDDWPFSLVLVNHLKMKANADTGAEERSTAGGKQVNFQESFEIEMMKSHKAMVQCADFQGVPLTLSCEKNSFGPTHNRIRTRVLWWHEEQEDGGLKQKTVWDWDWSTVDLLFHLMYGEKSSPIFKKRLADANFHLQCPKTSPIENTAWSKSLGMKKAEDAVSWNELGAMIRQDQKLMAKLRKALCIRTVPLLDGDYLRMRNELTKHMT